MRQRADGDSPPTLLKQPHASQTFQERERGVLFTRTRWSSLCTLPEQFRKSARSVREAPGSRQRSVTEASENTMHAPALFQEREGSVKSGSVKEASEERAKGAAVF